MAPSACTDMHPGHQQQLLDIARDTIHRGMLPGQVKEIQLEDLPPPLLEHRGAFVTLTLHRKLRGCVGNLSDNQPLARSVADAAHNAAFRDHRFAPMAREELDATRIEISVLSPTRQMRVTGREDLPAPRVPGIDGLVLRDGRHTATFLPKVWEQLPTAEEFLEQLMQKAGLPAKHWSSTINFERYHTTTFNE